MGDLPTGPALLSLARDVLLNDLLPLLPEEVRLDARLVANSMAIAEREAVSAEEPGEAILRKLGVLYGNAALTRPALRGGFPLSGIAEEGAEAGEDARDLLHRFAQDLRIGAFEKSEPLGRHVQEVLWQLTIAKLRLANPRFLTANGLR